MNRQPVLRELEDLVEISTEAPIWERFFTVAPLVLVATKRAATTTSRRSISPCRSAGRTTSASSAARRTRRHRNLEAHPEFTVSFPRGRPDRQSSLLAAGSRLDDRSKPTLAPFRSSRPARWTACSSRAAALYLECALERVIDGFGENSLIVGRDRRRSAVDARRSAGSRSTTRISSTSSCRCSCTSRPGRFAEVTRDAVVSVPG